MKSLFDAYQRRGAMVGYFLFRHANAFCLFVGLVLLVGGLSQIGRAQFGPSGSFTEAEFDDALIRYSVGNLFRLIEGAFGGLIMVVAGILAIVAAAMGAFRSAVAMVVVAIGAFILRALVSLFFGTDYEAYSNY